MQNSTAALGNRLAAPQKAKHRITMRSSNSTPTYISKGIENNDSNRYLHTGVYNGSLIHNSHEVETLESPSMGKNGQIKCNTRLKFYSTMKGNEVLIHTTARTNVLISETQPDMKGQMLYDSTSVIHLEEANSQRKNID